MITQLDYRDLCANLSALLYARDADPVAVAELLPLLTHATGAAPAPIPGRRGYSVQVADRTAGACYLVFRHERLELLHACVVWQADLAVRCWRLLQADYACFGVRLPNAAPQAVPTAPYVGVVTHRAMSEHGRALAWLPALAARLAWTVLFDAGELPTAAQAAA